MKSIENVIDTIVQVTLNGKLSWKKEGGPEMYMARLSNYKIRVWQWTDLNDNSGVSIQLLDIAENIIDRAVADEFSVKYIKLSDVFDSARRSANNVDEVIDDLETQLMSLK